MGLAPAHCGDDVEDRLIVLRITRPKTISINQEREEWSTLASRLAEIYRLRMHRIIYLLADSDVEFQTVADAMDIVHNANLGASDQHGSGMANSGIAVKLITPAAVNAPCPQPTLLGTR